MKTFEFTFKDIGSVEGKGTPFLDALSNLSANEQVALQTKINKTEEDVRNDKERAIDALGVGDTVEVNQRGVAWILTIVDIKDGQVTYTFASETETISIADMKKFLLDDPDTSLKEIKKKTKEKPPQPEKANLEMRAQFMELMKTILAGEQKIASLAEKVTQLDMMIEAEEKKPNDEDKTPEEKERLSILNLIETELPKANPALFRGGLREISLWLDRGGDREAKKNSLPSDFVRFLDWYEQIQTAMHMAYAGILTVKERSALASSCRHSWSSMNSRAYDSGLTALAEELKVLDGIPIAKTMS